MENYNEVFNWKDIYSYPFTEKVEYFFVLWYTFTSLLEEIDFNTLKKYLISKSINNINIITDNNLHNIDVEGLNYKEYQEKIFNFKKNYNIFWWTSNSISMSIDGFWLIWWDLEFIKFMIREIWQEELIERFKEFLIEWDWRKIDTWASGLINRKNCIDLFKIDVD